MPITFDCPCGKVLRVADENAGRRVKCPACNMVGLVPAPEPQFEVVEDEPAPKPAPRVVAKPVSKYDDDDDDDDDDEDVSRGYSVSKSRGRDDDDDDEPRPKKKPDFRQGSGRTDDDDDRPKKKKKKKKRPAAESSGRGFEGNVVHGGVAVGLLAMIGAVVWFVIGLANDILFFYPPVLFIIGLVAFIKGLTGEE